MAAWFVYIVGCQLVPYTRKWIQFRTSLSQNVSRTVAALISVGIVILQIVRSLHCKRKQYSRIGVEVVLVLEGSLKHTQNVEEA